jgi:hypothetical protein
VFCRVARSGWVRRGDEIAWTNLSKEVGR